MMVFVQYLCVRTHLRKGDDTKHSSFFYEGMTYFFPNIDTRVNKDDFKIVFEADGVTAKTIMVKWD